MTRWVAFVSVGAGASQSVLARNPHKGRALRDFPRDRKGKREGRSQRRQKEEEQRNGQKRPGQRTDQSREQGSQQKRAGAKMWGPKCWVGQIERMSQRSLWLCGNFAGIHARNSLQMHLEFMLKCHKLFPSCVWS